MTYKKVNWRGNEKLWLDLLSENFKDDPLYVHIFKEDRLRRKCLKIFFRAYLGYLEATSLFYLSEDSKACGVVFLSNRLDSKKREFMRLILMIFKMFPLVRHVGISGYLRCLHTLSIMSSQWIEDLKISPYAHMDLMVVEEEARGKGYFKHWLSVIAEEFSQNNTITLETQSRENVEIYKNCGFKVVVEVPLKDESLIQYGMVYQK